MKIRTDFITNSSSTSYMLFKKDLTDAQINTLKSMVNFQYDDMWNIADEEHKFSIYTSDDFCSGIDFPEGLIKLLNIEDDNVIKGEYYLDDVDNIIDSVLNNRDLFEFIVLKSELSEEQEDDIFKFSKNINNKKMMNIKIMDDMFVFIHKDPNISIFKALKLYFDINPNEILMRFTEDVYEMSDRFSDE